MRNVIISNSLGDTLFVQFCEGLEVKKSFTFWNYIGNGDILSKASFEWVALNILPEGKEKGLLVIDNSKE
jgi:hypothetical protein